MESAGRALRRLGKSVRAFGASEVGGQAARRALLLLALLLAINGLNVLNSYVGRDFMTSIEQRDGREFARQGLLYAGVFVVLTVAAVVYRFTEERLGLLWREWLTKRYVDGYLVNHVYYRVHAGGVLANPDQRMADDVRAFTTSTLSLALIFLNGLITIAAFSGVLWSISRLLFAVAVGYAALGSVLAVVFGRSLVRLSSVQSDTEAAFRAELVHVRENAEQVALLHREPHLRTRLAHDVDALTSNLRRIIAVNRNLGFFTTGYNYFIQLVPVLIIAPAFMRGQVEFGVISQSAMAFAHLVGAFSLIVNQFPLLSSYGAVLARLTALDTATATARKRHDAGIVVVDDESRFAFERLTLRSLHDGRVIVRELSLEVPRDGHVFVRVPTHGVETALQRAVTGIWESGEGRIVRPASEHVWVMPERPYLPPGTLRELLTGAGAAAAASDVDVAAVVRALELERAVRRVGGLDVARDWDDILSLEEQRLVETARIVLSAPRFAMLADLDAGLGAARAGHVAGMLAERGVGVMEIALRWRERPVPELVRVDISADGSWGMARPQVRTPAA